MTAIFLHFLSLKFLKKTKKPRDIYQLCMSSRYILWLTFLDFKNEMYPGKDKEDLCVLVLGVRV